MNRAGIIIIAVAFAALVILVFVTGWADDKAQPGSTGRGQGAGLGPAWRRSLMPRRARLRVRTAWR
jgi:hypothetical protein